MPEKKYKVCILAYSLQYDLAKAVLDRIQNSDVDFILMNCSLEDQDDCVQEALLAGCEVFVSGPGNTARFKNRYQYPIVEIPIRDIDYATAVKRAVDLGCNKIAVARHRYSRAVPRNTISSLLGVNVDEIVFEGSTELYELVKVSEYDAIVGTSLAVDAAENAGKTGILLYFGTDGIRDACQYAANLAREQYESRRNREITKAIMNNSQIGIIVTDNGGRIQFINHLAQEYTGLSSAQVRGKQLSDFFNNLSEKTFIKSSQRKRESYHIVSGAMMRCVQERIVLKGETIGVLTTLRPDSHSRKKTVAEKKDINAHIYHWEELTAYSTAMQTMVERCKALTHLECPTVILGERGSGREEIAYCLHGSSERSKAPCIAIDLATMSEQDAARIMFGYDKGDVTVSGLLSSANGGSIVLKNLSTAAPSVLACIQRVVTARELIRPGMGVESHDVYVFSVLTKEELDALPADFRCTISINRINMPSLRERKEDVDKLFAKYVSRLTDIPVRLSLSKDMVKLLRAYSWPGNVRELRTVATRFAIERSSSEHITTKAQYIMLLNSIGEEELIHDVLTRYPVLGYRPIDDTTSFLYAFEYLKSLTKYSNEHLGEVLGLSRTTLWRVLKGIK